MDQTLIIGLGNPDPILEKTYHNIGVLAVQKIAGIKFRSHKDLFSYATVGEKTFVRPLVYMNESGRAVKEAMKIFKCEVTDIVIIHDDSDIPIGDVKYSSDGGSAGHKGIISIIDHLKTKEFVRIRIGIRSKDEVHRKKAEEFVLSPIKPNDMNIFEALFEEIAKKISG
jgi:PTH1 family peptidyl-tRNA hydrolase